jgi:hypothetical protein
MVKDPVQKSVANEEGKAAAASIWVMLPAPGQDIPQEPSIEATNDNYGEDTIAQLAPEEDWEELGANDGVIGGDDYELV